MNKTIDANDNFFGLKLQGLVDIYFSPFTVDTANAPAKYYGPPLCQMINIWLDQIAFADPGLLKTMLEEWPEDKS